MIPKSGNISASSIATFEECPAKFVATQVERLPQGPTNKFAMIGTADHYACQHFVNAVYFHKTHEWSDVDYLIELYNQGYDETFGTGQRNQAIYKDGLALIKKWHARTDLSDVYILSTEVKTFLDLRPWGFEFNLTYILDRLDWIIKEDGTKVLRVVDYKTESRYVSPEDVKARIQPNIYGLAANIQYKDYQPDQVWVYLDMLRYDGMVGALWTRQDLEQAWYYLLDVARRIYEMKPEEAPHTLSPEGCRYCPIKHECPAIKANINAGGNYQLHLEEDIDSLIAQRKEKAGLEAAAKAMVAEIDEAIASYVSGSGDKVVIGKEAKAMITARGTRYITDTKRAADIIGPDIMSKVGKLNLGDIDKLLEDSSPLTQEQKNNLESLISKKYGDEKVEIKPISPVKKAKKKN